MTGHVACTGEMRNEHIILDRKPKERDCLGDLGS